MHLDYLQHQFQLTSKALEYNLDGISDEESFIYAESGGNTVNWVVGHIIATRDTLLERVNTQQVLTASERTRYQRGSEPIEKYDEGIIQLSRMRGDLGKSNTIMTEMFDKLENGEIPLNEELGIEIAGILFHEAYHVGQVAILRRFLGKEGVIK
jgi:hypothetical protein